MKKLLATAALACMFATPSYALTVFSDNFDSNPADQLDTTPSGWTLLNGTADIIGAGGSYDWYPGNGSYLDLDGSKGAFGQSTFLLSNTVVNYTPGNYKVSFDYGINHGDGSDTDLITLGAYLAGFGFFDLLTVDADALDHNGVTFTQAMLSGFLPFNVSAQLYFRGDSVGASDQGGGIVDNLRVNRVSAVPVPGAAILLLSGLIGLGGLSRFRRKT